MKNFNKKILFTIFISILFLNKNFSQTFYIENKGNSYIAVEAIIEEIVELNGKNIKLNTFVTELKPIPPQNNISINTSFHMPIFGELRGKMIQEKIKSIYVYSCKINKVNDFFETKYELSLNKRIISIKNTNLKPSIKYLNKINEPPIYEEFPISFSYEK
jgi:hypothetical protein